MGVGQVGDVDVVPHAAAVAGVVVVAEDGHLAPLAGGHLGDDGHEIGGLVAGVLADFSAGVGAGGVEVAQQDGAEVGEGRAGVVEDVLADLLGAGVGALGLFAGGFLRYRQLVGVAVDGAAATEDQVTVALAAQPLDDVEQAVEVIAVVGQGLVDAVAHGLESGEVDGAVEVVLGEELAGGLGVGQVGDVVRHPLAGDGFDAVQDARLGVVVVVRADDGEAVLEQVDDGVAADEPGAPGDEYLLHGAKVSISIPICAISRVALKLWLTPGRSR